MTEIAKPLTADEVAELVRNNYFSTQLGRRTLATIEQQAEQIEKLRGALIKVREWLCYDGPVEDDGITHPAFVKANNAVNEVLAATEPHR